MAIIAASDKPALLPSRVHTVAFLGACLVAAVARWFSPAGPAAEGLPLLLGLWFTFRWLRCTLPLQTTVVMVTLPMVAGLAGFSLLLSTRLSGGFSLASVNLSSLGTNAGWWTLALLSSPPLARRFQPPLPVAWGYCHLGVAAVLTFLSGIAHASLLPTLSLPTHTSGPAWHAIVLASAFLLNVVMQVAVVLLSNKPIPGTQADFRTPWLVWTGLHGILLATAVANRAWIPSVLSALLMLAAAWAAARGTAVKPENYFP